MNVPFFRPHLGPDEIREVVDTLESGWLTSGPKAARFEEEFAASVGARHGLAVCSGTAALHLAVEALGLKAGDAVLVPTMTFAATAEVVRYQGAVPVLVDCDAITGLLDLEDAKRKLDAWARRDLPGSEGGGGRAVGVMPVHVGGLMLDLGAVSAFARRHGLWVVEDAAHAFPAAWRERADAPWQRCGEDTANVSCFSFYANKTITTGEGGMVLTDDPELADRMKVMSLHGLSKDAWGRYNGKGTWDYRIIAPGFKYNMTDIAAAIGIHQLRRADQLRQRREEIAWRYLEAFASLEEIELPPDPPDRIHSWHLFPIRLRLDHLSGNRRDFLSDLAGHGVGFSVHWRPLHLHPYYQDLGWQPELLPRATELWPRLVSLPLFPAMSEEEVEHVIAAVKACCSSLRRVVPTAISEATLAQNEVPV